MMIDESLEEEESLENGIQKIADKGKNELEDLYKQKGEELEKLATANFLGWISQHPKEMAKISIGILLTLKLIIMAAAGVGDYFREDELQYMYREGRDNYRVARITIDSALSGDIGFSYPINASERSNYTICNYINFDNGERFRLNDRVDPLGYSSIINLDNPEDIRNLNVGDEGLLNITFQNNQIFGIENTQIQNKKALFFHIFTGSELLHTSFQIESHIDDYEVSDTGVIVFRSPNEIIIVDPTDPNSIPTNLFEEYIDSDEIQNANITADGRYVYADLRANNDGPLTDKIVVADLANNNDTWSISGNYTNNVAISNNTLALIGRNSINSRFRYGITIYDLENRVERNFIEDENMYLRDIIHAELRNNNLVIFDSRGEVSTFDLQTYRLISRTTLSYMQPGSLLLDVCVLEQ
jgi:hypothetical protein